MIKNIAAIFIIVFLFSCSKKRSEEGMIEESYVEIKYDTIAIDSFSNGAISVDIAAKIRRSSVAYQDSLRKVQIAADIAKKELADKKIAADLEKEKVAKEKKKEEAKTVVPVKTE